jgi:hypothetical protein
MGEQPPKRAAAPPFGPTAMATATTAAMIMRAMGEAPAFGMALATVPVVLEKSEAHRDTPCVFRYS